MADAVRLGLFSPSVVLGVASSTGALDRAGLAVGEIPVASSAQQFAALVAGELDAVFTSPDNVLAHPDAGARILAAVDRGLGLSLFSAPGVGPEGLRGGTLAVDVPTSGFAFVAYELLARLGLRVGVDYAVAAYGSTPRRATALIAGECAMTVLNAGNDLRAEAAGCTRLSRASGLGPYVGTVLAVRDPVDAVHRLTTVVVETSGELAEGRHRELAATVTAERLGLDDDGVRRYLATLSDPDEGLVPDGRLDPESMRTLHRLRDRYGDRRTSTR